jgi:UDP-N-acetylglucosamine 2-epimerase (non-hydrolysing)/GDP/UDP-N,N'-diacetylbacillosamine 2-epimerase (hydrolysing)
VTSSRADYGLLSPLLKRIHADPDLRLHLYVTGTHLSEAFGRTESFITADGLPIAERLPLPLEDDSPQGAARALAAGLRAFAESFARFRPDLLVLLGDRYELLGPAAAAQPFNLPVAHIHGGEVTEGALDECVRHALTKLSHLHFASTEAHAARLRQLGEDPTRITVSGAPGLDSIRELTLLEATELEARFGLSLREAPLLVTFHPVTRDPGGQEAQVEALLQALAASGLPLVLTQPNADVQGRALGARIQAFAAGRPRTWVVGTLGTQGYFSLMARAAAMVGNSSSGLIEAPSFGLPVVNVGDRQKGRTRGANVIDVGNETEAILAGIRRAVDPAFRATLADRANPYRGGGDASSAILHVLKTVPLEGLCLKPFHDLHGEVPCP